MTNEENINNIISEVVIFGNEVSVGALKYALSLLVRRKDQQLKEYLEKKLDEATEKAYNSSHTFDIGAIIKKDVYEEIINELFKENEI